MVDVPSTSEGRYVMPPADLARSSRNPDAIRGRLEHWLASRWSADATVSHLEATSANGMSSETMLFDAFPSAKGAEAVEHLVARIAPDVVDVPVFPSYDLERQFRVLRLVAELSEAPVPKVWWYEPDGSYLGAPFFVMSRVEGEIPPDILPYNFGDSWLFAAAPDDRRRLQDASVGVLAELHAIERPTEQFGFLGLDAPGDTPLGRKVAHTRAWYEWATRDVGRSPLVERTFAWLDDHRPEEESAPVLTWGDSRIGNVIYRDFAPVAILDWEMACLAPRELDVTWMVYAHRVFEDLAADHGFPGMPEFLTLDDVAATYERLTGHSLHDVEFFMTLAAVQYAIVFLRTGQRSIHFGEREAPSEVDELIMNRDPLERMLAGTYWS